MIAIHPSLWWTGMLSFSRLRYRRMWADELVIWPDGASGIGQVIMIRWGPASGYDEPIGL